MKVSSQSKQRKTGDSLKFKMWGQGQKNFFLIEIRSGKDFDKSPFCKINTIVKKVK